MKILSKYIIPLLFVSALYFQSCKKQDEFLNVKQHLDQVVPTTLKDFQAILDDNGHFNRNIPIGADGGSDNLDGIDAYLAAYPAIYRNTYLWAKDIYQGANSNDWIDAYQVIEESNIVLDGLSRMNIPSDQATLAQFNNIKGQALFFRSLCFYILSGEFCKPYISQTASTDLGIVLRLSSDVTQKAVRSTVQQTYDQMVNDMKSAVQLLPVTSSTGYQMRPTKPAATALLAKIYLAMSDYKDAADAASQSLNNFNTLLDFNSSLVTPGVNAFPAYPNNPEISFWAMGVGDGVPLVGSGFALANVDSVLYKSYDDNDLRKTCFYQPRSSGGHQFVSSYTGQSYSCFAGIATNEVLLIRAECDARLGSGQQIQQALADLNALLVKRYKTGTYVPLTITDQTALLNKILVERRKELAFTGQLRWEDLRRLNQDMSYAVTLKRVYQGQTYTLPANDPRYVYPIPDKEIQLTGIQQNVR